MLLEKNGVSFSSISGYFAAMSVTVASLNSGSNGNCYYVGNEQEAVLIDAGISCRETEKRMKQLGLSIAKIKAIFISHEHNDHILGLEVFARKYSLPIYITPKTLSGIRGSFIAHQIIPFKDGDTIQVGNIAVFPFSKKHDAADPHSFLVESHGIKVGVFTDIGSPCHNLAHYFRKCKVAFLEANYDEDMLLNGRYPHHLKHRIHGDFGHLSNRQALDFFLQHRSEKLSHLILSHLSKENNHPEIVAKLFQEHADKTQITIASRQEASALFHFAPFNKVVQQKMVQAKLF